MKADKSTGWALILGPLLAVLALWMHPMQGHHTADAMFVHTNQVIFTAVVISLGIVTFGLLRLARTLACPAADAGLVAFVVSALALMLGAGSGHAVAPRIMQYAAGSETDQASWHAVLESIEIAQGVFALTGIVAWAVSLLCLSASLQQFAGSPRIVAYAGFALGALIALLTLVGHIELHSHAVIVAMLLLTLWTMALGVVALRSSATATAPALP